MRKAPCLIEHFQEIDIFFGKIACTVRMFRHGEMLLLPHAHRIARHRNRTRRGNSSFPFHFVFRIRHCVFSSRAHISSWSRTRDTTSIRGLNHGWNRTIVKHTSFSATSMHKTFGGTFVFVHGTISLGKHSQVGKSEMQHGCVVPTQLKLASILLRMQLIGRKHSFEQSKQKQILVCIFFVGLPLFIMLLAQCWCFSSTSCCPRWCSKLHDCCCKHHSQGWILCFADISVVAFRDFNFKNLLVQTKGITSKFVLIWWC